MSLTQASRPTNSSIASLPWPIAGIGPHQASPVGADADTHALNRLGTKIRVPGGDDDILDVPMSRRDVADYLGLTIETVCRVLSEMKREGMVTIPDARHLALVDIAALQTIAGGGD